MDQKCNFCWNILPVTHYLFLVADDCPDPDELLSGKYYISDWAFEATSAKDGNEPHRSRLDSESDGNLVL